MMPNLSEHLQTAVRAAHAAAEILQSHTHGRDKLVIDKKAKNDLVSAADREAEALILEILKSDTPEYGIVAEETGGKQSGIASWLIDPLDGTTNFLHGIPHYAVSISLVAAAGTHDEVGRPLEVETPVVGVVYDPCKEEMFTAMHGVGAWLNGTRIHCSTTSTLEDALIATGLPFRDFSFMPQYMPVLTEIMKQSRGIRRNGAAALDLAWTACGRFDGYWEQGLSPWDLAAGTLLVREAGGIVKDMGGHPGWPASGDIVCGNPAVFKTLWEIVQHHRS